MISKYKQLMLIFETRKQKIYIKKKVKRKD